MKLFIYGSGGNGSEICDLAECINRHQPRWDTIDFIDDIRKERHWYGRTVYRFDELLAARDHCECVISLGEPVHRRTLYDKLRQHNIALATLVHPRAEIAASAFLGEGCIVETGSFISSNSLLEANVMVEVQTIIGHDIRIGQHCVISSCSVVGGNTNIGDDTFIGLNCAIKDHCTIGQRCIIGMGSTLFRDIEDDMIVMGNPARPIRRNEEQRVFK